MQLHTCISFEAPSECRTDRCIERQGFHKRDCPEGPTAAYNPEETPAILEELLSVRADCLRGMLGLASGGSGEFCLLVERRLMKDASSWGRMMRFYRRGSTWTQELPAFRKEHEAALPQLRESERRGFLKAVEYALRVNKMNVELFLQRVMRGWLTLHIVSTATMFGLAAVYIFSVLYY